MLIEITDDADPGAELRRVAGQLRSASEAVLLVSSRLRLPQQAVAELGAPRPGGSSAVVSTGTAGAAPAAGAVRVLHHRVIDVATDVHVATAANAQLVGVVRIADRDRAAAASALSAAADVAATRAAPRAGAFSWAVLALVRRGVTLKAEPIDPWPWTVADPPPEVSDSDAARIRLLRANRSDDGFYSVLVLRRLSKPLSNYAAKRGWSPNAITVASLIVGLAAAVLFATGQRWALVFGAVLLQVSIVVDCSDGEVARLTGRYSSTGAWLDASTDRVKEYAAYAGLAFGAGGNLWWLAGATMTLQTARHLTDYTFHQVQVRRETAGVIRDLADTAAQPAQYTGIVAAAARMNERPGLRRLKRVIFLPIGERWLIISLTAALLTPWWTFVILLGAGAVSACYALAGRILRTRTWPAADLGADMVRPQIDDGPVAWPLSRALAGRVATIALVLGAACWAIALGILATGSARAEVVWLLLAAALLVPPAAVATAGARFAWAAPAVLAAAELATWLLAAWAVAPAAAPWAFAVAFAVAFHRYDLLYRTMAGAPAPRWIRAITGGVDGRLIVAALLIAAGATALTGALPWLAAALAAGGVVLASTQWLVSSTRAAGA